MAPTTTSGCSQDRRQRDLQNALDENNRLLRDDRARRGILLPPIR
jgi:hypothetical protein